MPIRIQIWSDFVCPYCLLAETPLHQALEEIGEDGTEVEWMPFELRPEPVPTLLPEGDYLQSVWKQSVRPLAERLGVDIDLPAVSPQPYTRLAFEGYQYAAVHGLGAAYVPRVLRAFFQEGRDIGRPEVLRELAVELGLDGEEFERALREGTYREAHQRALRRAEEQRIRSVPTILIDGRHRIEGVPSPERLAAVLRRARDEAAADGRFPEGAACGIDGC